MLPALSFHVAYLLSAKSGEDIAVMVREIVFYIVFRIVPLREDAFSFGEG